jgi:hypothetical protein
MSKSFEQILELMRNPISLINNSSEDQSMKFQNLDKDVVNLNNDDPKNGNLTETLQDIFTQIDQKLPTLTPNAILNNKHNQSKKIS